VTDGYAGGRGSERAGRRRVAGAHAGPESRTDPTGAGAPASPRTTPEDGQSANDLGKR
jgi:hypothetical protein